MPSTIVVTGSDSAHYDLVTDLLTSLTDVGREGFDVGYVHVGDDTVPRAIDALADRIVHRGEDDPSRQYEGWKLAFLMIKPQLPSLFPGYDTYVWLDGDTWVQDRAGIEQIVHCAQLADLCAHPEIDPDYYGIRLPSERLIDTYTRLYDEADAAEQIRLPMFNSGVVGARANSPLWPLWAEALADMRQKVLDGQAPYFTDQVPMHRLIATGRLRPYPLKAINNWLMHAATPALDLRRRQIFTPTYPHELIHILHLTWVTKDRKFSLGEGRPEITFRYRDIRPLFRGG